MILAVPGILSARQPSIASSRGSRTPHGVSPHKLQLPLSTWTELHISNSLLTFKGHTDTTKLARCINNALGQAKSDNEILNVIGANHHYRITNIVIANSQCTFGWQRTLFFQFLCTDGLVAIYFSGLCSVCHGQDSYRLALTGMIV